MRVWESGSGQLAKVFWFFFSKKNSLPFSRRYPAPLGAPIFCFASKTVEAEF
jgi:hypothetical protein